MRNPTGKFRKSETTGQGRSKFSQTSHHRNFELRVGSVFAEDADHATLHLHVGRRKDDGSHFGIGGL
jgi:hypothetical protein